MNDMNEDGGDKSTIAASVLKIVEMLLSKERIGPAVQLLRKLGTQTNYTVGNDNSLSGTVAEQAISTNQMYAFPDGSVIALVTGFILLDKQASEQVIETTRKMAIDLAKAARSMAEEADDEADLQARQQAGGQMPFASGKEAVEALTAFLDRMRAAQGEDSTDNKG